MYNHDVLHDNIFVSLYAGDLKIAVAINSPNDTTKFQTAINQLERWCSDIHLNLDKCSVLSISNKRESNIIIVDYKYLIYSFKKTLNKGTLE